MTKKLYVQTVKRIMSRGNTRVLKMRMLVLVLGPHAPVHNFVHTYEYASLMHTGAIKAAACHPLEEPQAIPLNVLHCATPLRAQLEIVIKNSTLSINNAYARLLALPRHTMHLARRVM